MSTAVTIANEPKFIAVTAIDDLKNHTRLLVFENHSTFPGTIEIVPFPEQCSSIFYNGTVYDWYGREASLDPCIQKILTPSGQTTEYGAGLNYCCDRFLAKLNTGDYAYVSLRYHAPRKIHDPDYAGTKYAITGGALNRAPYIDFEERDIIHNREVIDYATKIDID